MSELSKATELKEKLCLNRKNGLLRSSEETVKAAFDFCEGYKLSVARQRFAVR